MMQNLNSYLIREKRKTLGLSQAQVAKEVGVSKVAVCWYVSGERTPNLENFLKLADTLQVSLDELAGREVSVVTSNNADYTARMSKRDVEIVKELKKHKDIYRALVEDPERTAELIDRRMK